MAVTATVYGPALQTLGEGGFDLPADTLKILLATSSYTPDQDTHRYLSSVTGEATGAGYARITLSGVTWTYDTVNNRMVLDADDALWTAITSTFRYAVVFKDTGSAATSPLLSYVNFGADQSPAGIDYLLQWNVGGIFRVTAT